MFSPGYLVSPSDKELCRHLSGVSSPLPEEHGADVLVFLQHGLIAWQRKTVKDLVASLNDGRLARELPLLQNTVNYPVLIVEGSPDFGTDGRLRIDGQRDRITKPGYRNLLRSVYYGFNVRVEATESIQDTATAIRETVSWAIKPYHSSLTRRPKSRDEWGNHLKGAELHKFLLQGFNHIGPRTAAAIIETFGGRAPLAWTCSEEELAQVKGIGRPTAAKLIKELHGLLL